MKRYTIGMLFALPLFIYNQNVHSIPTPIKHSIIKKKILTEKLMASHLPERLAKNLQAGAELAYATGHSFYDTPIELLDENGKKIHLEHQFKAKNNYKMLRSGTIGQASDNIWFFSPSGINPEAIDDNACTAEAPCRQITQQIVDFAHQYSTNSANFWFATGNYEIPTVQQGEFNFKLIQLHNSQAVKGKSADFRNNVYDDERPLISGTLAWTDYSHHDGQGNGFIGNMRVHTSNNELFVNDTTTAANLYSANQLFVYYCELKNDSINHATNVDAKYSIIYHSQLKASGAAAFNIRSTNIDMLSSRLESEGDFAMNILAFGDFDANVVSRIDNSYFSSKQDNCGMYSGIAFTGNALFLMNVVMDVRVKNPNDCDVPYSETSAVAFNGQENSKGLVLVNSSIKIFSESRTVIGIKSLNAPVRIAGSQIDARSVKFGSIGIESSGQQIEFQGDSSRISVFAPDAQVFKLHNNASLNNNSNPPSQCVANGRAEICQQP